MGCDVNRELCALQETHKEITHTIASESDVRVHIVTTPICAAFTAQYDCTPLPAGKALQLCMRPVCAQCVTRIEEPQTHAYQNCLRSFAL